MLKPFASQQTIHERFASQIHESQCRALGIPTAGKTAAYPRPSSGTTHHESAGLAHYCECLIRSAWGCLFAAAPLALSQMEGIGRYKLSAFSDYRRPSFRSSRNGLQPVRTRSPQFETDKSIHLFEPRTFSSKVVVKLLA